MGEITVEAGETLSHLALRHLGDVSRWPEIYRLNALSMLLEQERRYPRRLDRRGPDWVFEGQKLKLPALSTGAKG